MELSVGYTHEFVEVGGQRAVIYLFEHAGNEVIVTHGDWVKFFGKNDAHLH